MISNINLVYQFSLEFKAIRVDFFVLDDIKSYGHYSQ
jgi:hypothetical protein